MSEGKVLSGTTAVWVNEAGVIKLVENWESSLSAWLFESGRCLTHEELSQYDYIQTGNDKYWFNADGKLHREGGPAVVKADTQQWWLHGQRHREGGPAVTHKDGGEEWWVHGQRHREGGPAIVCSNGKEEWWVCGKRHRTDGPAITRRNGTEEWWISGKRHRTDGPAITRGNGTEVEVNFTPHSGDVYSENPTSGSGGIPPFSSLGGFVSLCFTSTKPVSGFTFIITPRNFLHCS